MDKRKKSVFLIPLDPVHDFGLRLIKDRLDSAGHLTCLLPPDLSLEEIAQKISQRKNIDHVLVSRTIGYGATEILGRFIDLMEAIGIRRKAKIAVGGMGINIKLAAELGFDAGFASSTTAEEALAYVEDRKFHQAEERSLRPKTKRDMTRDFSYSFYNDSMNQWLEDIAEQILCWAKKKTSPGIERAKIRQEMINLEKTSPSSDKARLLRKKYLALCDPEVADSYMGRGLPERIWPIDAEEARLAERFARKAATRIIPRYPLGAGQRPLLFVQVGSGSPLMDIAHMKICEAWGVDGIITICPSSGARNEGLFFDLLNHEGDGTLLTLKNLSLIKKNLCKYSLWGIRAHRGLNSPEAMLYAGVLKADMSKLNFVYGSLGAGTDPERLVVDTLESIRLAARFGIPFDIPSNDELGGIPTYKSFAGLLVMLKVGLKLGARPIPKPLFCYSPWIILSGKMEDNYVDFNAAKIKALRALVDAPVWIGEPAGFMTHTEDRVQSALTTALHIELGRNLGAQAITMASTDEAYSRGVINVDSRLDSMKAVDTVFRFMGEAKIAPTSRASIMADELISGIESLLKKARDRNDFVRCLNEGVFGSEEDGVHPGRTGRNTVVTKSSLSGS